LHKKNRFTVRTGSRRQAGVGAPGRRVKLMETNLKNDVVGKEEIAIDN
jgi:hypothetical protein